MCVHEDEFGLLEHPNVEQIIYTLFDLFWMSFEPICWFSHCPLQLRVILILFYIVNLLFYTQPTILRHSMTLILCFTIPSVKHIFKRISFFALLLLCTSDDAVGECFANIFHDRQTKSMLKCLIFKRSF